MGAGDEHEVKPGGAFVPMLPELRAQDQAFRGFNKTGWSFRGFEELAKLGEALAVPNHGSLLGSVDAVPDVWARVLLFSLALTDSNHVLHSLAVGSFRGFLGFLALSRQKHWPIDIETVDLDVDRERFAKVLQRLAPKKDTLATDTGWNRIFVFVMNGEPVGITSPLTLVYPAEGAHLSAPRIIPWWRGGRFVDPISSLVPNDRAQLSAWILDLKQKLVAYPSPQLGNMAHRDQIVGELDKFATDLGPRSEIRLSDESIGLNQGIFIHLGRPLSDSGPSIEASMVRLRPMRGTPPKELLVLDFAIAEKWNTPESQILCLSNLSIADIRARVGMGGPLELSDRRHLHEFPLPAGIEWRLPGDFFADKLAIIENQPEAFPGTIQIRNSSDVASKYAASPILPVKSELLSYLTPDYIKEHTTFEISGDTVRVALVVPLGADRTLQIGRTYSRNDIITLHLPVLEIWPNFQTSPDSMLDSDTWRVYYSFWDTGGDRAAFYARPHSRGVIVREAHEGGQNLSNFQREIVQLDSPPEYYTCFSPRQDLPDSSTELGILLVNLPVRPLPERSVFDVGVDFGTTNTHVFLRKQGDATLPRALRLECGTHQLTAVRTDTRSGRLYRFFVPTPLPAAKGTLRIERAPFLSFFRRRPSSSDGVIAPIVDGHILFYQEDYNLAELREGNISSYLKWEQTGQEKLTAYIEQIALHASVEAFKLGASQLNFHYSVPTAFSKKMENRVQAIWANSVEWLNEEMKLDCKLVQPAETESIAAAKYFCNPEYPSHALTDVGAVFVDIGGATSDLSVWRKDELQWQASIKLAGRDLLARPFFHLRSKLIPLLNTQEQSEYFQAADIQDKDSKPAQDQFCMQLDAFLRTRGDSLQRKLALDDKPATRRLLQVIGVGLAGLFYYLGLVVRHLRDQGLPFERMSDVYVGGNGCRLFHWVANGNYVDGAPITELLKAMLFAGADMKPDPDRLKLSLGRQQSRPDAAYGFQIKLSQEPKAEAAYGLVTSSKLQYKPELSEASFVQTVGGEPFRFGQSDFQATSLITQSQMNEGVEVPKLESLVNFVTVFNRDFARKKAWGVLEPIKGPDAIIERTQQELQQWCSDQRGRGDDIEVEPIFVVGLRSILRLLTE